MVNNRRYWLIAGAGAGLGFAWLARRYARRTTTLARFERILGRMYAAEKARCLAGLIQQKYTALLSEQPSPHHPSLKKHLQENILPGLALYQVLLQDHNGDQAAALAATGQVFREWTIAKYRLLLVPLKILPDSFWLFKLAFRQTMKAFPAAGWDFQYVENSDRRIAFNATRCFYLNTLTAYGAPELTRLFCMTDDVMAEMFPPSVRFVRLHTLGRGNEVCDFQYCRGKPS